MVDKNLFAAQAHQCAIKLCGQGNCFSSYKCDHVNHTCHMPEKHLSADKCPLDKYRIEYEGKRPWWTMTYEERCPSDAELFAVCAHCENSVVSETDDSYELELVDWEKCMYCPVHSYVECQEEAAAEAACS